MNPLIERLFSRHGFARVDDASAAAFGAEPGAALLVFLEDPQRVRETLDLAVIVPELALAFPGRFRVGVVLPGEARTLQGRYGLRRFPACVIVRDGSYLGAIEGLRTWDEYTSGIAALLGRAPSRPPGIGVAVQAQDPHGACG